ncbi:MAG: hypothetical protein GHCLOJNM_01558 [bacterium]|nr:hypothetical protein [bacterium]
MRVLFLALALFAGSAGAQETGFGPFAGAAEVIDLTRVLEFKRTAVDMLNADPAGTIDLVLELALAGAVPSTTSEQVPVHPLVWQRWFSLTNDSFMRRAYKRIAEVHARERRVVRDVVADNASAWADEIASDEAERSKLVLRLGLLRESEYGR